MARWIAENDLEEEEIMSAIVQGMFLLVLFPKIRPVRNWFQDRVREFVSQIPF